MLTMKSPDPHDPVRLSVHDVKIKRKGHNLILTVDFIYDTWEPSDGQDIIWEQENALTCLRDTLGRGGLNDKI